MGMFDTICSVPVKCPRCGDDNPKPVQIKCGPQLLLRYEFGKDKIKINWTYEFYNSIIDDDKKIIGGIATCQKCKDESNIKMDELIKEVKDKGELKCPEGAKLLVECEIDGKNALRVILNRLDAIYGGNRDIELFDAAITLDNNSIPVSAAIVNEEWLRKIKDEQKKTIEDARKRLGYTKADV